MAAGRTIETLEGFRETLVEIRRLRTGGARSEYDKRLAQLEAAAADYSERLRAAELEKGRPDTKAT